MNGWVEVATATPAASVVAATTDPAAAAEEDSGVEEGDELHHLMAQTQRRRANNILMADERAAAAAAGQERGLAWAAEFAASVEAAVPVRSDPEVARAWGVSMPTHRMNAPDV